MSRITLICKTCNKPFSLILSQAKRGRKYCSSLCFGASYRVPLDQKFWKQVNSSIGGDDCWIWEGRIENGYGKFYIQDLKTDYAHRIAFRLTNPSVDMAGLVVRHSCDNPLCCNPKHLLLGSQQDNVRDRCDRGRTATGDNAGPRKHIESRPRGEQHGNSKLGASEVQMIRKLYSTGEYTYAQLGSMFDIHYGTIGKIVKRKAWTHID